MELESKINSIEDRVGEDDQIAMFVLFLELLMEFWMIAYVKTPFPLCLPWSLWKMREWEQLASRWPKCYGHQAYTNNNGFIEAINYNNCPQTIILATKLTRKENFLCQPEWTFDNGENCVHVLKIDIRNNILKILLCNLVNWVTMSTIHVFKWFNNPNFKI